MLFQKTQKRSSAFARYGNLCEGYKINKPLSGLLVYRLIMSLAERLSLKYYICPRSFASQQNINFLDNISAADIISRHTNSLKGLFTV